MSELVEVVVEIPKGSRNKYEYDHERDVIRLDRRLFTATFYPGDYGFIVDTLGDDGDPLDVLIILDDPTFPGCHVSARPLGMFVMEDEAGRDAKIICVLDRDPLWEAIEDLKELPPSLLSEIEHFFDVYKTLEPGKKTTSYGFEGRAQAWDEIHKARRQHDRTP